MNKKLILDLVKSKDKPLKQITDEQALIKVLSKEIPEVIELKKLQSNKKKKKTAAKNKKKYIMFDERRHKSPTIKKTSIGDDSITKRRVRDIIKRSF